MKRLAALFIALAAWVAAAPALAAITVLPLSTNTTGSGAGVTTLSITTTTNDCPVGSYVFLAAYVASSSNWTASDSVGNSYSAVANFTNNTNQHVIMAIAKVGTDVAIGTNLTFSWTTAARLGMAAACITGLAATTPLDKTGNGWDSAGTGTSIPAATLTTGTLGASNEVVMAVWGNSGGTYASWTEDGNFTNDGISSIGTNNNVRIAHCVTNCAATTSVAYATSWTTARANGAQLWTFKPPSGAAVVCTRLLLGVGPC